MEFELLDRYLLEGKPPKADVVKRLLAERSDRPAAQPFYEGMRMLGARTPDLTLYALRLVLAGKKAGDEQVVELRDLAERVRAGGDDAQAARASFSRLVSGT
ncbi:MAG TPA: hypothetical protein VFN49_10625 [Candidatus Aquilonibacter sp.]|nr:hypothetical protein [Candidatus Aquilonibacter sp.]